MHPRVEVGRHAAVAVAPSFERVQGSSDVPVVPYESNESQFHLSEVKKGKKGTD